MARLQQVGMFMLLMAAAGAWAAASRDGEAAVDASIDQVLGDHARYRAVFDRLQQAVADHDAAAFAALVSFPIEVNLGRARVPIAEPAQFVASYDRIITPAVAAVITGQQYAGLMVSGQGVMFGDGQVWLNGVCKDTACKDAEVKVVTIQDGPHITPQ